MPVTFQSLIIKDLAKNYSDFVEGCRKRGGVGVVGRGVGRGLLWLKELSYTTQDFKYAYNIRDGEFLLVKFLIVYGDIAQHLWVIRFP